MNASGKFWFGALALASVVSVGACADDEVVSQAGGSSGTAGSSGSGGSGGTSGSGGVAGSSGSGATGGVSGSSGSAGSAGSSGSAGGDAGGDADAGGPKFAEIQSMDFTVECAVDAGADQVSGEFAVLYDNSSGAGSTSVLLSNVDLVLTQGASAMKWNIKPSPAASGIVGAGLTSTITHNNITGTGTGTGDPCDFCTGTMTLEVDFTFEDDAGAVQSDTFGPIAVKCNP